MSFSVYDVHWWIWLLCSLAAWGARGLFEAGGRRHGESISGPLAVVFGAVAVIAGLVAFATFCQSIWARPQ